jgi:hypothetical protein
MRKRETSRSVKFKRGGVMTLYVVTGGRYVMPSVEQGQASQSCGDALRFLDLFPVGERAVISSLFGSLLHVS